MVSTASGYTPDELMMTALCREVQDGRLVAVGTLSPLPAAGCLLASLTHAPHARLMILGDPDLPLDRGFAQLFDMAQRGLVDVFFLSFVQLDAQCNLNLTVMGDYRRPKVRFPGGAGSPMLYHLAKRVVLFKQSHTRKDFVPKVDFATCSGWGVHLDAWQRPGRLHGIITSLAIMRVKETEEKLTIASVHPGHSPQEVVNNTGFLIEIPEKVEITEPPTEREVALLRTVVRERLAHLYPQYCKRWEQETTGA